MELWKSRRKSMKEFSAERMEATSLLLGYLLDNFLISSDRIIQKFV
jgi:hypothetical protein